MKSLGIFVVLLILCAHGVDAVNIVQKEVQLQKESKPAFDTCGFCFDFMDEAVNDVLNEILNGGVVGGCSALCSLLANPILTYACTFICDYVGIDIFVKAINVTDPDPIYICQEIDFCPVVTGGAVTIKGASVSPTSGPQGTTFDLELDYSVTSPTGPGLQVVNVFAPDGTSVGGAAFSEGQPVGTYSLQMQLDTTPSEQEAFAPGKYTAEMAICEGDCTDDHPNGGVYGVASVNFAITGN